MTNGFQSRDQELFNKVTHRIGDVAGLENLVEFNFSNDLSIYASLGGKWGTERKKTLA